uniref:Uncharacterized protein n=1 Tax=Romanomermis culicivorax TaxID=13658 RepID=A0A915JY13_ROMCU
LKIFFVPLAQSLSNYLSDAERWVADERKWVNLRAPYTLKKQLAYVAYACAVYALHEFKLRSSSDVLKLYLVQNQ